MLDLFDRKSRCYNGGKRHCFRAVFTKHVRPVDFPYNLERCSTALGIELARRVEHAQTYHGSVCAWCGATANVPAKK